jgi:AraC-like DNA-binding protein
VDAELVLGKEILDIRERMQEAGTILEKFKILEKGLLSNFLSSPPENPFVDFMLGKLLTDPDQTHLKDIVQKIGYSQKHMIKIFKENVGVTPKHFLKVIRFQKAIAEIEARQQIQWTNVAFDCGFYDQSHFIADFKTFSGWTPEAYLRQRRKLLNYIPIAE